MRSLQRRKTTSSMIERRRKQVSKRARNNFFNPKLSFPLRTGSAPTEFTLFFNADKVTQACKTNKATRSKTKKLTFILEATKFCLVLRWTPAVPTQTVFSLRINTFLVGKSCYISTKRLRFVVCWFSFTLRWNDRVKIKLRSDAFLIFLFKIRLKRETKLMQACSANQHQVIMASWLPKVPSWLRKKCLLSQPISMK